MALPKSPISIQVSPSTYVLIMKLAELSVTTDLVTNDLRIKPGVQTILDRLYTDLITANTTPTTTPTTTLAELQKLQADGLFEAQEINKEAGYEKVMAC
jgi:hypothetical protein